METVGGLLTLTMLQKKRTDGYTGTISAKVEPSMLPSLKLNGIFMEVNDHYDFGDPRTIEGSNAAISILEAEWDQSIERSENIIDQIMILRDKK
jgi:hypothetical protein